MQLFIPHLARWLRTRRFSESTFWRSGATNQWKNTVFRDFPTFSRTCIFFLLTLSFLWLWSSLFCSSPLWLFPPLLFHLSILSEVWLLNFLRLDYIVVRSAGCWCNPAVTFMFFWFRFQFSDLLCVRDRRPWNNYQRRSMGGTAGYSANSWDMLRQSGIEVNRGSSRGQAGLSYSVYLLLGAVWFG